MSTIEDKDSKNNGRWTKIQHEKFLLGLQLFGKNWKKIQQIIGTRSGAQIRSHAQKFFLKTKDPRCQLDNQEGSHDNQQLKKSLSVISKQNSITEQNNSQYSYFLDKILKASSSLQPLNFWEQFIDLNSSKKQVQPSDSKNSSTIGVNIEQVGVKRKDSFVIFDICGDSKQQTSLSAHNMLGQPIL